MMPDKVTLYIAASAVFLLLAIVFMLMGGRQGRAFMQAYRRLETRDLFLEDVLAAARQNSRMVAFSFILGAAFAGYAAFDSKTGSLPSNIDSANLNAQDAAKLRADLDNATNAIAELTIRNEQLQAASAGATADEARIDSLKQEFEKAFVNFYYLQHCGQATVYDALLLQSALIQQLSQAGAPARVVDHIANTALSTYQTLYAKSPCDNATIQPVLTASRAYNEAVLRTLALRFSAQSTKPAEERNSTQGSDNSTVEQPAEQQPSAASE